MSDNDGESAEMEFRADSTQSTMNHYRDNVLSQNQQIILNKLKIDMYRENLIYLNNHREVNIDCVN